MKNLSITPLPEHGKTRHFKVVLTTLRNKYTLITSSIALVQETRLGVKKSAKELERMTKALGVCVPNKRQPKYRTLIGILAVIGLYLYAYPANCNTTQIIGYVVGLVAVVLLGIIIYRFGKIK